MTEQTESTEAATAEGTESSTFDATAWQQVAEKVGESPDNVLKKLEHARTWEKRAKENADAAAKLAEIEESQKSETQKLQDQLAAEKAERERVERESLRFRIAAEKGVPADYLDLLPLDTEEEMSSKADKLVALLAKNEAPPGPRSPAPDPRQGGNGGGQASTAQQFAAAVEGQL